VTRRLLVSYLAITVIVLLILEIPLAIFYSQREEERFIARTERDAVVLASFYEDALESGGAPDPAPVDDYVSRSNARVIVVDRLGISVLDSAGPAGRNFLSQSRPEVSTALAGVRAAGIRRSDTLDTDLLYIAVPVASGGRVHGMLRVTLDAHEVTERIHRFWIGLVGVAAVVLLAVAAIGTAVAQSVTQPLRGLQESARRFADGRLSTTPVSKDGPAEVQALGHAMNTMAQRLDELIQAQRSFVSDASHQLRTPLTAIRLRLENLETRQVDRADRAEVAAAIDEIERLAELVAGLLQLARAEQTPPVVRVDAATIVSDRIDTWTALADDAQVELQLLVPVSPLWISAVPGAVEQLLDNTLDNALNASPPNGAITVRVVPSAETTLITISDQGPGLDDDAKHRALERFWQGDTETPGTGLGLAIAQTLAKASGGSLTLEDSDDGGLRVVISMRNARAASDLTGTPPENEALVAKGAHTTPGRPRNPVNCRSA